MTAKPLVRTLLVLASVAFAIGVPAVQATQHIGLSTAEFAGQGDQTLRAAGYAFAIWGLIYAGLVTFGIYQATPWARETPTLRALGWPAVVAITGCGAWILASAFNQQLLSVVIIVTSAATLAAGLASASRTGSAFQDRLLVVWPLSLLAGWLTIASAINILTVLTAQAVISPALAWAVLGVAAVTAISGAIAWRLRSAVYLAPVIWGLVGVYVAEQGEKPPAAWLAAAAALILLVEAVAILRRARP